MKWVKKLEQNSVISNTIYCAACLRPSKTRDQGYCHSFLCWDCDIEATKSRIVATKRLKVSDIGKKSQTQVVSVKALYYYTPTIRKIVLNAKIRKDIWAIEFIKRICLESFSKEGICSEGYLLPFPSSVPGRMQGELDLAWIIADTLRKNCRWKMRKFSSRAYWRFTKEAQKKRSEREKLSPNIELLHDANSTAELDGVAPWPNIRMIDDIITSGTTLHRCLGQLDLEGFTPTLWVFASALPQGRSYLASTFQHG